MTEGNPNTGSGLLLGCALVAAIFDFIYVRRGGVKSTRRQRAIGLGGIAVILLLVAIAGFCGFDPGALGTIVGFALLIYFVAWEIGRWRIRRRNPLPWRKGDLS